MTVREVTDRIIKYSDVPFALEKTCDILAAGSYDNEVTGIVTTFMATAEVIRKAAELGANLIITHEPTYFNGWDTTDWLKGDPVYDAKMELINITGMSIWRYHDHMHMKKPDAIYTGIVKRLGWESYAAPPRDKRALGGSMDGFVDIFSDYYDIPPVTLAELAKELKQKLSMDTMRVVGRPSMTCKRVGILVGGGSLGLGDENMPAKIMRRHNIDVMVCGEITEWTLCAYVNDAMQMGLDRAMLVAGHERTEEWGMEFMAEWLPEVLDNTVSVTFVDAKEPFIHL